MYQKVFFSTTIVERFSYSIYYNTNKYYKYCTSVVVSIKMFCNLKYKLNKEYKFITFRKNSVEKLI